MLQIIRGTWDSPWNQYFRCQISLYANLVNHRSRIQSSSKTAFQYLLRKRLRQKATCTCLLSRFSLGFHSTSKNGNRAASQVFVGNSGLFWSICCRELEYVPSYSCFNVLSPMLCFTMNTFPTKQKGWKDEVSLRNSRISSPQIPVRVAPQHCVTKDCFVLHISLYALRTSLKSGTNANKLFHIFSFKTFSLQSFHPASPCNTHQGYNHQETLRRSIFCLIQNYECVQNPALRTNLTMPCSQTDPVLSSPLLPMTLLHLCVLFGKFWHLCISVLKLLFAAPLCSESFSR